MPCKIPLSVAIDVEPAHHAPTLNRLLPNPGMYSPSLPANVAGEPHIQGQQARHYTTHGSEDRSKLRRIRQPGLHLLFVRSRVATEVSFNISGPLQALFNERPQPHLRSGPLDGRDKRVPARLHFRVRRHAGEVDQLLGVDEGLSIE